MSQETKILLGIGVATIIILVAGVFYLNGTNPQVTAEGTVDKKILVGTSKNTVGKANAKVTVVEFADFQCPACGAAHPEMKKLQAEYKDTVYFVFRHFPLSMHRNAIKAGEAAQAAGAQGKFWEMHDMLFETQSTWSDLENPAETFIGYAKLLKLDEGKFKTAFEGEKDFDVIKVDMQDGQKAGVSATPTIFVNGKQIIGAASIADLIARVKKTIDDELATAK